MLRAARRGFATASTLRPVKDCTSITPPYPRLLKTLDEVRRVLPRESKLTLAEKILYAHLRNPEESLGGGGKVRGERYLKLRPDRVAMQDASAQMALLQFMTCGLPSCSVPASIHCDHLIQAQTGATEDLSRSIEANKEVFDFLQSAAEKYGIEFWQPGSGIIHQIVLENYAAPGLLMLGTDSHTPNAGGLGMLAIGVGGADAVDALTDTPWELKAPLITGVKLTGELKGWATPKDLILHLAGKLAVRGGTGRILEYFGPGVSAQSCTGLATIANMGAEVGATTSTFPYSQNMQAYLHATGRGPVADAADNAARSGFLDADEGAEYDEVIEINLSDLEPHLNGPFTPDLATPLSKFPEFLSTNNYPTQLSSALIGSCTNSSYEDMSRVTSIAEQASAAGLTSKVPFLVTPGSELIRATIERDGLQEKLEKVGATVLANACGPCIGQWKREDMKGEDNAILTSFNRNFKARNDGNLKTMNFLASPEIVTAMAFAGNLNFNPTTDTLQTPSGKPFKFDPPSGSRLPSQGYTPGNLSYSPSLMPDPRPETQIQISPDSTRLEILEPFESNFGEGQEFTGRCLMRVRGKCTTDHISAAGAWLKYKGHLSNISENTLMTAVNDENGQINSALDVSGEEDTIPHTMQKYRARNEAWMLVVDDNYGEGSAREHAALQPRFYGCGVIVARSFARIHETNLKKQGILPLWLTDKSSYALISAHDTVQTLNMSDVLSNTATSDKVVLKVTKPDGTTTEVETRHTLSSDQVEWLRAGSALNWIGEVARRRAGHANSDAEAVSSGEVLL